MTDDHSSEPDAEAGPAVTVVDPECRRLRRARLTGAAPLAIALVLFALAPSPITGVLVVAAVTLLAVWLRGAGPRSRVEISDEVLVVHRGRRELLRLHRSVVATLHVGEQGVSAALRVVHRGGREVRLGVAGIAGDVLLAALTTHGWPASRALDPRRDAS